MFTSRLLLVLAAMLMCSAAASFRPSAHAHRRSIGIKWPGAKAVVDVPTGQQSATVAFPDEADFVKVDVELEESKGPSLVRRIKKYFSFKNDGMTSRQRIAKMGLDAILSYGFIQNVSYTFTISLAWYLSSMQSGLSPLAPGQWKPFLAINAGFMVFQNIIRPVHVALAVIVSPYFDRVVQGCQTRFGMSRRMSIGFVAIMTNLVGTLAFMGAGIALAATCAGVPIFV